MDWFCAGMSPLSVIRECTYLPSLQYALIFLPGLFVGRLFDMGYTKAPLGLASVMLVATTFLTAQCKEYWQFILCQGIATGVR